MPNSGPMAVPYLCGFAAAGVPGHYEDLVVQHLPHDHVAILCYGQVILSTVTQGITMHDVTR